MKKRILLSSLLLVLLPVATNALADPPAAAATGLGQSWPAATDVSSSGHFHVYVFERAGVRYVQVNDLDGKIRGAFGVVGGQVFALPMGLDAARIATPADVTPSSPAPGGEVVYRSDDVQVIAYPQPSGGLLLRAIQSECKDPDECGHHV
ncbi:hypothetical protein KCV01_g24550, partial [Aureobasidium melanogenum]